MRGVRGIRNHKRIILVNSFCLDIFISHAFNLCMKNYFLNKLPLELFLSDYNVTESVIIYLFFIFVYSHLYLYEAHEV